MKACIIQPPYSYDPSQSDAFFQFKLDQLDKCDESMDLIVLPEYSDVPCVVNTLEEALYYHEKYIDVLLDKCRDTARRCHALVFVNALSHEQTGYRNTTYAFNRSGELVGKYFKKHLPPSEKETFALDSDYTETVSFPDILEIEGIRFGFLTCYDLYFYEAFARIAREKADVMIVCSLQRTDTHEATEILCRFLAYHVNAYVLRASVSFDEKAAVCGASMIVSPTGSVLCNMRGRFGLETAEFDPHEKYYKPAGFGGQPTPHYAYLEYGRKPWQYRIGGPSIVPFDRWMKYPRVCAHRGFNTIAPENSLPAFGAAVAMGAEEIEFDLWATKDGVLVSCHDATLDRVSDGHGKIYEHTYAELLSVNFGAKADEPFNGIRIPTFEEILQKFSGHTIMNIHVKIWDHQLPDPLLEKIVGLIRQYDAEQHVYFMTTNQDMLRRVKAYTPNLACCLGWDGNKGDSMTMVDSAAALGCEKIQLFKPYFNADTVKYAHARGILCNVFWADDPQEARDYLEMGIDTILTNDYHKIAQVVQAYKKEKARP